MKKSFIASILLLQMFIQPSYADESDGLSGDLSNASVTLSYRSAVAGNHDSLSKYSAFNHGGSLGVYYPIPGLADIGVEVDVLNPKDLFLDREKTEADMLTSPILYSGILKLQKRVALADDLGLVGGIGLGPTYVVFDTPTSKDKKPFEKRELSSKWSLAAVGDLSLSIALTEYVYGTIGYSLQYSPLGKVAFEETDSKGKPAKVEVDASALFAHALKVGISTTFGAFLA
ncbi:hypothetical protein [Neorickettsia findlayensis]|uniref:P44/Msp2 family outer membrane protein n=1 Tax=Neorickettsia findlayensis TaxID=2686014 RepID=A0A6P1GAY9_9RICK|nr:hypothetical protein [Neorickettsia findlayensis]QHD65498.1 hypothetical protein GP480_03730 [Neorickettsia findlayensis]